jgi:hypothetical protein
VNAILIGGAPGTGKTTAARTLARRHGLRLYSADTRTWEHRDRALAAGSEAAARFEALGPHAAATDEELIAMSLHHERGPMVLDDLRALPEAPLVIAEGTPMPAAAVTAPERAAWMLRRLARRGTTPVQARLYELLSGVIEAEAREHGVPVTTDPAEHLAAAISAGPHARGRDERRALLREMNEDVAAQVRGYLTRPWATGDEASIKREFACECGDPECLADVRATIAVVTAGPVTARGHE